MTRRPPAFLALAAALLVFAVIALALAASISAGRRFQVDEIEHVHAAHLIESGELVYRDFWEGHNPLLWMFLMPVVDDADPVGSFARGRVVAALFWVAILGGASLAARFTAGWWAAAVTALLLVLNSTFIERGLEIRPDGPLAACVMAALCLETARGPRLRRSILQAFLLSAGFLFTQKGAFFCFAFGVIWLVAAIRERRMSLVAIPTLCWALPVAIIIGIFAALGNLEPYLRYNVFDASRHVARATSGVDFSALTSIRVEGGRNREFVLLSALALLWGAGAAALATARGGANKGALRFDARRGAVLGVAVTSLVYLAANPFPYPYLQVAVLPSLAVLIGVGLADAAALFGSSRQGAVYAAAGLALLAALAAADSFPRLAWEARDRNEGQMATLREVQRITAPDDAVFDLVGLHMREDPYPVFVMTGVMLQRYRGGEFPPIIPFLQRNEPVVAMTNYRTVSLPPADRAFLGTHFVHYAGSIYVLGRTVDLEGGTLRRSTF